MLGSINKLPLYRLTLYYLIALAGLSIVLSALRFLPYNPIFILFTAIAAIASCWLASIALARVIKSLDANAKIVSNKEAPFITGLILALLVGPLSATFSNALFVLILGILAIGSRYLISLKGRPLFNPAAFAVLVAALFLNNGADWWVGAPQMLPFVALGGLLVLRKAGRIKEAVTFLAVYLVLSMIASGSSAWNFNGIVNGPLSILVYSAIVFFACIMLVEPLTSPTNARNQLYYALLVALCFAAYPFLLRGVTPVLELSLLTGNAFSFLITQVARSGWRAVLSVR